MFSFEGLGRELGKTLVIDRSSGGNEVIALRED
jgi:hypothetical protein